MKIYNKEFLERKSTKRPVKIDLIKDCCYRILSKNVSEYTIKCEKTNCNCNFSGKFRLTKCELAKKRKK